MADKSGFLLLLDQYAPIENFTLEQKGLLLDAFFHFHMGGEVSINDPAVAVAFSFFRQSFERNASKYDERCRKNKENITKRYSKSTNVYDRTQSNTTGYLYDADADADAEENKNPPTGDMSASTADDTPSPGDEPEESVPPDCPHEKIIAMYHDVLPELSRVSIWNEERKKHLRTRWREVWDRLRKRGDMHDAEALLAWWGRYFARVRASPFLVGKTTDGRGKPFYADLEWLVRPTNFAKVVDGKYLERQTQPRAA